jgi:hypothetical protein
VNGNTATAKGDNTFEGKAAVTAGNKAFARISGKVVEAGSGDLDAAKYTGGKPHFLSGILFWMAW